MSLDAFAAAAWGAEFVRAMASERASHLSRDSRASWAWDSADAIVRAVRDEAARREGGP
jgi:hypothetical protein